jgi:Na+-driven multidrug efflux pump
MALAMLRTYFSHPPRKICFRLYQKNWQEVFQAAYNGISEFINEVSGALIGFIFNWMLIQRRGVTGVAAIILINYMLFIGFMAYFAISNSIQVIISQNVGARNSQRILAFLRTASIMVVGVSAAIISLLIAGSESLIGLVIGVERDKETLALALEFVIYIWVVFVFSGFTRLISGYLTAVPLPFQSALVASCRSLIMPVEFLILFYKLLSDYRYFSCRGD